MIKKKFLFVLKNGSQIKILSTPVWLVPWTGPGGEERRNISLGPFPFVFLSREISNDIGLCIRPSL